MPSHSQACRITAEPLDDGIVVRFDDPNVRLDEQTTELFREQVLKLVETSRPRRLTLDLGNVQFLSSTTLGVLVSLRKKLRSLDAQFTLVHLRPEIYDLFVITQLNQLLDIRKDEPAS